MELLKTYLEATKENKSAEESKPAQPKILTISKKIANELIKEFERILEDTDEFQDLTDKERKRVEFAVIDMLKNHGW